MAYNDRIKEVVKFLGQPAVVPYVISYMAEQSAVAAPYTDDTNVLREHTTSPPITRFVSSLAGKSCLQVQTMITSLVYLRRLQVQQCIANSQLRSPHRILLTSLILSDKYFNDSPRMNTHWVEYCAVPGYQDFGFLPAEINRMERDMLGLLNWDLQIEAKELYAHIEPLLARLVCTIRRPFEITKPQWPGLVVKPPCGIISRTQGQERNAESHSQCYTNAMTTWWSMHTVRLKIRGRTCA